MKLEIHHLAPYLPYGLTVINTIDGTIMEMSVESEMYPYVRKTELNGIVSICVVLNSNVFKPILRPLSDLTKEIKYNGIKLIPAIEIAKRVDNGHNYKSISRQYSGLISIITDKCDDIENVNINLSHNGLIYSIRRGGKNIMFSTYQTIKNLLLEWNFDIFGLIDQGLAVNINDLNQKK